MHHDSIPSDTEGPISHRIADIQDAYTIFARRGLTLMGDKISGESVYRSNEHGHLAWDVALLVRAACLTWRVTGDVEHLRQAVTWAKHMIDRTDAKVGIKDWRGESGPVWSAGSRYTAGTAVVGAIGEVPIRLQGAADRLVVERPTDTTAIIRVSCDDGRSWSSPEASLLPEDAHYLPDVLARRSTVFAVLVRGLPGPVDLTSLAAGQHDLERQFAPYLVHTGGIARSLIAAADALESADRGSVEVDVTPGDLYEAATQALLAHDHEIRTQAGNAWYITPEDFPSRRLGLDLPHNHVVDAATSFLILGRRLDRRALHDLGASLTRRFREEVTAYESGSLRHPWFYYPVDSDTFSGAIRSEPMAERQVPGVPRAEDSSHATMRVRALCDWKGIDSALMSDDQMRTVALSFRRFYMAREKGIATLRWLPGDADGAARQGHSDTFSGAWGALTPWDPTIKRRINSMAYRHPPTAVFGATVLSAAEIIAMNSGLFSDASVDRTAQA